MSALWSRNTPRVDTRAIKARQQSAWASGDYAVVGSALQSVGEELCESLNLAQDARVLDVAVGNNHASLAAARRWCEVTATDIASDVANRGRQRMAAQNLGVRFIEADAEALPFGDQSFDAVVSTFGAMFSPDQDRAASEMIRVCRRGCQVGIANWTPEGFIGRLFAILARHAPPGVEARSPFQWGTAARLEELFAAYGSVWITRKKVVFRYKTPADWVEKFRASYVPALTAFAQLDAADRRALRAELIELIGQCNRANDSTMVVDAEYLEVIVTRR
jgi:ubiquinone/menaquinone biosynthesis C-methylase UbiE